MFSDWLHEFGRGPRGPREIRKTERLQSENAASFHACTPCGRLISPSAFALCPHPLAEVQLLLSHPDPTDFYPFFSPSAETTVGKARIDFLVAHAASFSLFPGSLSGPYTLYVVMTCLWICL